MFDDLQSDGLGDGRKRERPVNPERPLADREVPLGPPTTTIAEAVHAWLDGEAPESSVRRSEWSRDVDFWRRMNEDLERRRRMRTPAHVQARIMEAIPQRAPSLITPWWRREFVVTPSSALVAAATLLAVAVAATAAVLHFVR
jgi:hypothetical protein